PAGDSTIITVGFTPEYAGVISGQVVIYSNDSDDAVMTVNITGTGMANTPDIEVSQTTRSSGAFDLGDTSCDINGSGFITIRNSGRATLQISSITVSGDFTVDNKPISIEAGSSKKVYINYSSQEARTLTGEITILSNDPDESVLNYDITAQVFDSEQQISGGTITINEADNVNDGITYGGELEAGHTSPINLWTITNNSDEELIINVSSTDNNAFTIASTITVAAGENITITAQFAALLPYSYSTEIELTVNDEILTAPLTLSVDSYAVFGNRTKYVFTDNDNDQVTVSLTKATGKIFLGNDNQPDIRKIEVDEITGNSNLTIKTQRGGYTTLGELTAQGNFSAINASSTNLSGNINIDGEVGKLILNEIEADSQIDYATAVRGGTMQFNSNAGAINIDGMLKNLKVTSDLSGTIQVNGNINIINANEINQATINAAGYIKTIRANNIDNSDIYASDNITSAVVKYDMTDSVISAGYSPVYGSSSTETMIKNVLIRNTFSGSIISSGVTPDNNDFMTGTANNLTGSIGKVKIGQIADTNDIFGVVASSDIRQIIIGRDKYTTDHQENNFIIRENMV
ncbi:MAG: choice-of-anchor D domain-containing protein, partial [Sedimentisphaerales bacterium]|nr:choice-of-anchor D domain-containing protein [Sedimentisphaerales bacterium]